MAITDSLKGLSIFLIGMMGTGKTSVGQVLARQLSYRFFDSDEIIERVTQQAIKEIFASQGEEAFREIESQVLQELAACTRSVIATGGGSILRQMNWSYLHHGLIIWLDAPVELLSQRLSADTSRPLLEETDPSWQLQSLLEQRRPLYSQADLHLQVQEGQTPEDVALKIIEQMPTALKL